MTTQEKANWLYKLCGENAVEIAREFIDTADAVFDEGISVQESFDGYETMSEYWNDVKEQLELLNKK